VSENCLLLVACLRPYGNFVFTFTLLGHFVCSILIDLDSTTEVRSNAGPFHSCRSLASISEKAAPPGGSKQSLLRRLSEPLSRVCTCPSVCHMADMEGTITFVVPELSEKTLMNVSIVHIRVYARNFWLNFDVKALTVTLYEGRAILPARISI